MIGRTNAVCVTSGGVTTVDLPTHPASIAANSGNAKATITLTYTDTDYISGVEVRYKTGGYPTSPTDGNGVTAEGAAASIDISGLTNGTKYYFRAYLYREVDGVKYYQTDDTNAKGDCTPSGGVIINGITPAVVGENYVVIDKSGTFTMTVPDDTTLTAYVVGGGSDGEGGHGKYSDCYGGNGGSGARVLIEQMNNVSSEFEAVVTIGAGNGGITKMIVESENINYTSISGTSPGSYGRGAYYVENEDDVETDCSKKGSDGVLTLYGYVCSNGGGGGAGASCAGYEKYENGADGGIGAGAGGNCNACGGDATNYGCGGGGGGYNSLGKKAYSGGAGKQGCIILTWDN